MLWLSWLRHFWHLGVKHTTVKRNTHQLPWNQAHTRTQACQILTGSLVEGAHKLRYHVKLWHIKLDRENRFQTSRAQSKPKLKHKQTVIVSRFCTTGGGSIPRWSAGKPQAWWPVKKTMAPATKKDRFAFLLYRLSQAVSRRHSHPFRGLEPTLRWVIAVPKTILLI